MIPFPYSRALLTRRRVSGATDPNFANVSLLLHMNGTNGSTTFTDSSPNTKTVSVFGNAQISTTQSKFGGASGLFDGNSDYLEIANNSDFDFGSGDFTIEFFIRLSAYSAGSAVVAKRNLSSLENQNWAIFADNTGSGRVDIQEISSGSAITRSLTTNLSLNTWTHIAFTRQSNTLRGFFNGSKELDVSTSHVYSGGTNPLRISRNSASGWLNGYLDELRITKGVARYTANFTPPTAQFPDS